MSIEKAPEKQMHIGRRRKIFGVELPPTIEESQKYGDLPSGLFSDMNPHKYGFDSEGNYLTWDGFSVRFPEFKNIRFHAWRALKIRRNLEPHGNLFGFNANNKARFFLYSPASLFGKIHRLERLSTFEHLKLGLSEKNNYLTRSLVMEEAISSAQLEGAATTRPVAKEMLSTGREPKDFSERMILNNWHLMSYAKESINEPLSLDLISRFNSIATDKVCENGHTPGALREEPINVESTSDNEVIHKAPDADDVLVLLTSLCKYANTDHEDSTFIHPLVKAIVIHFMIGYIHPFLDGNGRTARALFYWYVLKSGYSNFQYISISSLLKSTAKQYSRAYVHTETDEFDLTHFIDFNLNIIIKSLEDFGSYINKKIEAIQETRENLHTSPLYPQFKLQHITILQKGLQDPGREFTVKEVEIEFNVSSTAARAYLEKLVTLNLLIKYPLKGRQFGYMAPKNLRERLEIKI